MARLWWLYFLFLFWCIPLILTVLWFLAVFLLCLVWASPTAHAFPLHVLVGGSPITLIRAFQVCIPKDETPFLPALDEQSPGEELEMTPPPWGIELKAGPIAMGQVIGGVCIICPTTSQLTPTEQNGVDYPQKKMGCWHKINNYTFSLRVRNSRCWRMYT